MSRTARIAFYVQHLMGIGHLQRAANCAALSRLVGMKRFAFLGDIPFVISISEMLNYCSSPLRARDLSYKALSE